MRFRRRWKASLALILAVILTVLIAVALFLNSPTGARQAARILGTQLGTRVEIDAISFGWAGSKVVGLRVFEPDSPPTSKPLLNVSMIKADLSLRSLFQGAVIPRTVIIQEPAIRLRFAEDGRLVTKLPQLASGGNGEQEPGGPFAIPSIRIEKARVAILQTGKPKATLAGIELRLDSGASTHTLRGSVDDVAWGRWRIQGEVAPSIDSGLVEIQGLTPIEISTERIARLPLVDPSFVQDYPFEARVVAGLSLRLQPASGGLTYRAEARLEEGKATIRPASISVARLNGSVVIENSVIYLKNLSAAAADGTIRGDGRIDLTSNLIRVNLAVGAQGLDVTQVPPSWGLHEVVEGGRFSGKAHLLIDLPADGPIRTNGEGRCVVNDARVLGAVADGPVELTLRPTANGFRFGVRGGPPPPDSRDNPWSFWISFVSKTAVKLLRAQGAEEDDLTGRMRLRFGLRDMDLTQVIRRLPIQLPFSTSGLVSFRVEVNLPADTPDDLEAYRVEGSLVAPNLSLEGIKFRLVKVRLVYRDGILKLEELSGHLSDSSGDTPFVGSARLGVVPVGDLSAKLSLERLPLAWLSRLAPGVDVEPGGVLSGMVELSMPAVKLKDVTAWNGRASFHSPVASALGWTLRDFNAEFNLHAGIATLARLQGDLEEAEIRGTANLRLDGDLPFQARLALTGMELASVERLVPRFRPPVQVEGKLRTEVATTGRLRTRLFRLAGLAELAAAKLEHIPIERLGVRWDIDQDRVRITDIGLDFADGRLSGTVEMPLKGETPGTANFSLRQVELRELASSLPALRSLPLSGRVDGAFAARVPTDRRELTASANLTSASLRIRGIEAENVEVSAKIRPGGLDYRLAGQTLGGTASLNGALPLGESFRPMATADPIPGHLRVDGIRLERLVDSLKLIQRPSPLVGVASLTMDYHHEPGGVWPIGKGRFRLAQVRWDRMELMPAAQADLNLSREQIQIHDVSASLMQGRLRANGTFNLSDPDRSWVETWIEQVPVATLLSPLGVPTEQWDARVTLNARSLIGRQIRGGAVVMVPRAKINGLTMTGVHSSVDWNILPTAGRGELSVRRFSGQLAGGRVEGKADILMAADGTRVRGSGRFANIEVGSIAKAADHLAAVGVGRASGTVEVDGRDVRSIEDLTGTMRAKLGPSQALRMPVLEDIVPFLGPGRSAATSFKQSELLARLTRGGLLRVERLALAGPKLSVFAEGIVALSGRLDLDVVATTGDLTVDPSLLVKFGMNIPAMIGPIPVGLIIRASKYLSDRTVRLEVLGTARSPRIRVNPMQILSEEAIRFFLGGTPIGTFTP